MEIDVNNILSVGYCNKLLQKNHVSYSYENKREILKSAPTAVIEFLYNDIPTEKQLLKDLGRITRTVRNTDKCFSSLFITDIDILGDKLCYEVKTFSREVGTIFKFSK